TPTNGGRGRPLRRRRSALRRSRGPRLQCRGGRRSDSSTGGSTAVVSKGGGSEGLLSQRSGSRNRENILRQSSAAVMGAARSGPHSGRGYRMRLASAGRVTV